MTVLVASDLDRTLIYSRRAMALGTLDDGPQTADPVCVEMHDGRRVSFMSAAAATGLAGVAGRAHLVPVTTRIADQYARVRLPGPPPRHAIAANGGLLLVDGVADRAWSRRVAAALRASAPLAQVWEHAGQVCSPAWTSKLRNAAGLFCYAVVQPGRLPPAFLDDVTAWAAARGWRTSLQGRKLYWVPESLTKSAAVAEVAARVGAERVLAAGDSLLDVDLLLAADRGIHPRHGELFDSGWTAPHVERTAAAGLRAGEQIVDWFRTQIGGPAGADAG